MEGKVECIEFDCEKKYLSDFIHMTSKLYSFKNNTHDSEELKHLLSGTHILSKYFVLRKFCIYQNEKIVARFALTLYPDDDTAYLGFVEGIEENQVWRYLFEQAEHYAEDSGCKKIVGPVNASFWIGYRLKSDFFKDEPFTGEPYHREYYLNMFLKNGYEIIERYTSSFYGAIDKKYTNPNFQKRYKQFKEKGYRIISPEQADFDTVLEEIYYSVSELYRDFPIYKKISCEDFCEYMKRYFKIINLNMVKIGYYEQKLVGFFVALPNYGTSVYHVNKLSNILKVLYRKMSAKEYVLLYMGVDSKHKGLGSALAYSISEELKKINGTSIGALIHEGKVTQAYASDLIIKRHGYVLLEKKLK
jgi:hypothetical protein